MLDFRLVLVFLRGLVSQRVPGSRRGPQPVFETEPLAVPQFPVR